MRRSILLLGLLLMSGCFFAKFGIPGSGKITTVNVPATGFTRVHHSGVGTLNIKLGDMESVSITTDDNLQEYLEAVVVEGELVLRNKKNENLAPTAGITYDVTVKSLSGLRLSGVGSVRASDLKGESLKVECGGVGEMKLSGAVDKLDINVDGVGNFDSSKLDAKQVSVKTSGVGTTTVKATESLTVKANGIGGVTYYGKPKETAIDASGIGKVKAGE